MSIEQCAKVFAIKYVYDLNSFKSNERMRRELTEIRIKYSGNKEFDGLFDRYIEELSRKEETPMWARQLMAERYRIYL